MMHGSDFANEMTYNYYDSIISSFSKDQINLI